MPPPLHVGDERVLARFDLHRNYCGVLQYFAQFTSEFAADHTRVRTPGLEWTIRCNGLPRDPYLPFDRIVNPWGLSGFPISLRLDQGTRVEMVVRRTRPTPGNDRSDAKVGGRLMGRFWYDTQYGSGPGSGA